VAALKFIVSLFLGLVLQLSLLESNMPTQAVDSCAPQSPGMSCCDGLASCPCAKESPGHEKPAPLLPASMDLKFFVSKFPEAPRFDSRSPLPTAAGAVIPSPVAFRNGYAGVPLSVAFCSFVI
jgi:hypothetical protein